MPIYKIYKKGVQERNQRRSHSRARMVALLTSAILLSAAVLMLVARH